jgi:6,7-dimethyl-8-ribityllumazine synthase
LFDFIQPSIPSKQIFSNSFLILFFLIEGATGHDEIVVQHAARKIMDISLESGKPVTLGISGPGMTRMEAHQRVDYAKRAVEAAVKMVERIR